MQERREKKELEINGKGKGRGTEGKSHRGET
jgi:hypothetical protein